MQTDELILILWDALECALEELEEAEPSTTYLGDIIQGAFDQIGDYLKGVDRDD